MQLSLTALVLLVLVNSGALATNCDTLRVNTNNGWRAFEVITQGNNPSGGTSWSMPGTFDGAGAYALDADTIRIITNHETGSATISQVDVVTSALKAAIANVQANGNNQCGVDFVEDAARAYSRYSSNGGSTFTTSNLSGFSRFCSGQAYEPDTFGLGRGFVDRIYITGEEVSGGELVALDLTNRDLYRVSGVSGTAPGGIGGMSFDSWENAALVDSGETDHIALLLAPDGGSQRMKLYIGEKGKDTSGNNNNSNFLARNGLAYGSWYYLNANLPSLGSTNSGTFDTTSSGALSASKLEDIDTSPSNPTKVVLAEQNNGIYTFDFTLDFSSGAFSAGGSSFTISKIRNNSSSNIGNPDNIDWTDATTLGGTSYPDGIIFVNEDNSSGQIWQVNPDGSSPVLVGSTTVTAESTGIFDLSELVGYKPGSIMVVNNQGSPSSMSVLINPNAALTTPTPPTPTRSPTESPTLSPITPPTGSPTQSPTPSPPTPTPPTPVPPTNSPTRMPTEPTEPPTPTPPTPTPPTPTPPACSPPTSWGFGRCSNNAECCSNSCQTFWIFSRCN